MEQIEPRLLSLQRIQKNPLLFGIRSFSQCEHFIVSSIKIYYYILILNHN